MTDNNWINKLQIKSYYDFLHQQVTELDEINFENFMRHKFCSQCRHDHSFKPSFNDVQTSIDHASELISSFFNRGSKEL